jgi:branched-subunit amino acid aminotransferase/4-amino-4-deoxychorismate lyase
MMDIYLNGDIVSPDKAALSPLDAGFQHAVGLFETMGCYGGKIFRLDRHLGRLRQSANELGLTRDLETEPLRAAVETIIEHNRLERARIRLTITPGPISLLRPSAPTDQPPPLTVMVVPTAPTQYDPAYFDRGITVLVAPPAANPFDQLAGHKTVAYWSRLRTLRQAAAAGAGEAIWLNITNHLASGAISNIFIVKNGKLLTPIARGEEVAEALPAPVLPGVIRSTVLELAEAAGIACEKRMISVPELLDADEVLLTNSSWLVLPVTKVEQRSIADGQVGPMTKQLRMAVVTQIIKETGGAAIPA